MFLPWESIEPYMGCGEPTAVTLVLFRLQCAFFGFFTVYFLFLGRLGVYHRLIGCASVLVAFMGFFMYLLKLQTGKDDVSSNYEPFIWLVVGSVMYWLNRGLDGQRPGKRSVPVVTVVFRIYAVLLGLNVLSLLFPRQSWELLFSVPFSEASTYDRYTFGMVSGFMAFSSVIVYYLSDRLRSFPVFSIAVQAFSFFCFATCLLSGDCLKLYTPLFIGYIAAVEILMVGGLVFSVSGRAGLRKT